MALRDQPKKPSKGLLAVLLVASFTLVTLDSRGGDNSPIEPMRAAAGEVFGPVEEGAATLVRPFQAVPDFFQTTDTLRARMRALEAENSTLRSQVATTTVDRNRAAELDGLLAGSRRSGHALVPARVVALGPAQAFSRTVTIDAGTTSGVHEDMTVLNNDGLVGRVIRADRSTATVLLVIDADSVVGGRLGSTMEVGFLRGRGDISDDGRLDLDLVDNAVSPTPGDILVTWGSENEAPYVAGVPIGRVLRVFSSPRELSKQAVIDPLVDFSALDLVGVVVDPDTSGDRKVIRADAPTRGQKQGGR